MILSGDAAQIGLWISVGLLVYTYLGYPLVLAAAAALRRDLGRHRVAAPAKRRQAPQSASVIICARNEQSSIGATIEAALEAMRTLVAAGISAELIVLSDASDDGTDQQVARYAKDGVRLIRLSVRHGKRPAQDVAAAQATGNVLAFLDADTRCAPDALLRIVQRFDDPEVGFVGGSKRQAAAEGRRSAEGAYERYEEWIRRNESSLAGPLNVWGSICAVRKALYLPGMDPGAVPDMAEPLSIVRRGFRVVHEGSAVGYETADSSIRGQAARKRRIVRRALTALRAEAWCLNPLRAPLMAWQVVSHKLLRWTAALSMAICLVTSALLVRVPAIAALLGVQCIFYALGVVGYLRDGRPGQRRWLHLPGYFVAVHVAALAGLMDWLARGSLTCWEPRRAGRVNTPTAG